MAVQMEGLCWEHCHPTAVPLAGLWKLLGISGKGSKGKHFMNTAKHIYKKNSNHFSALSGCHTAGALLIFFLIFKFFFSGMP